MNGFSTGEEDSRGPTDQICCLIDENERCRNAAGNASYSKRVQKTVTSRRLKLSIDSQVYFHHSFCLCFAETSASHIIIIIILVWLVCALIRFAICVFDECCVKPTNN